MVGAVGGATDCAGRDACIAVDASIAFGAVVQGAPAVPMTYWVRFPAASKHVPVAMPLFGPPLVLELTKRPKAS